MDVGKLNSVSFAQANECADYICDSLSSPFLRKERIVLSTTDPGG